MNDDTNLIIGGYILVGILIVIGIVALMPWERIF